MGLSCIQVPSEILLLFETMPFPTNLQSVAIFNSVGQRVWMQNYDGTAYTEMPVDLSNQAAGVYIVKMQYTDKTIIQRIVKQ
jgi:hypothetical protein